MKFSTERNCSRTNVPRIRHFVSLGVSRTEYARHKTESCWIRILVAAGETMYAHPNR